jgi:cytochrome P450
MTLDATRELSWTVVASSATALCAVAFGYAFFKGQKRLDAPPVAPGGMLETIDEMSGPRSFAFTEEMARSTGSRIYQLNLPSLGGGMFIVADCKAAREIMLDATSDKPGRIYHIFSKIGGTPNIFTRVTADPHWKIARKGSALAFSSREVSRMNRICMEHLEKWIKETLDPMIQKDESFDPSYEMTRLTFHIIMESAFEYKCSDKDFYQFEHHVGIALREFTFRQATNPLRATFGFFLPSVRAAHQSCLFIRAYAQTMLNAYRASTNKSEQNTLIRLIESNEGFETDAAKVSELVTYIIAGFDTVSQCLFSADYARRLLTPSPQSLLLLDRIYTRQYASFTGQTSCAFDQG